MKPLKACLTEFLESNPQGVWLSSVIEIYGDDYGIVPILQALEELDDDMVLTSEGSFWNRKIEPVNKTRKPEPTADDVAGRVTEEDVEERINELKSPNKD